MCTVSRLLYSFGVADLDKEEIKDKLLKAYSVYYNVSTTGVMEPFFAEAEFHQNDRQYFLIKAAKIAESDSHEYAYFADVGELTEESLLEMCDEAWRRGLYLLKPKSGHKNTDVLLFIIADSVSKKAAEAVKRTRKYKSYKLSFWGFSRFRLVTIDISKGEVYYNREGKLLESVVGDIL